MEKSFNISSDSYKNFSILSNYEISNTSCFIHINNEETFQISLFQAIFISRKITEEILNDITKRDFFFDIEFIQPLNSNFYNKTASAISVVSHVSGGSRISCLYCFRSYRLRVTVCSTFPSLSSIYRSSSFSSTVSREYPDSLLQNTVPSTGCTSSLLSEPEPLTT